MARSASIARRNYSELQLLLGDREDRSLPEILAPGKLAQEPRGRSEGGALGPDRDQVLPGKGQGRSVSLLRLLQIPRSQRRTGNERPDPLPVVDVPTRVMAPARDPGRYWFLPLEPGAIPTTSRKWSFAAQVFTSFESWKVEAWESAFMHRM